MKYSHIVHVHVCVHSKAYVVLESSRNQCHKYQNVSSKNRTTANVNAGTFPVVALMTGPEMQSLE